MQIIDIVINYKHHLWCKNIIILPFRLTATEVLRYCSLDVIAIILISRLLQVVIHSLLVWELMIYYSKVL